MVNEKTTIKKKSIIIKGIAREIGKDLGTLARKRVNAGKTGLKGLAHASKIITYPTLGNLSESLKGRIEDRIGEEGLSIKSTLTSCFTNVLPPLMLVAKNHLYSENQSGVFSEMLLTYAVIEGVIRGVALFGKDNKQLASLPGKLVSIVPDYLLRKYDKATKEEL